MAAGDLGRVVLGTAGLGLPYGLPGPDGAPPALRDEAGAISLLRRVHALGIAIFDTAPAYGVADERLGKALGATTAVFWSKLPPAIAWDRAAVRTSLATSLARLGRQRLDLLQVHNWRAGLADAADFLAVWRDLAADPRVAALGCSTYGVDDARAAVRSGLFHTVQVEWNLLNQAVVDAVADEARARGVRLAVRSVLLQGVLTARGADLPPHLHALAPARAQAEALARACGLDVQALALRAALAHPGIDLVLLGIDRDEQVADLTAALATTTTLPPPDRLAALHLGGDVVDPRTWPARQGGA